MLYNLKPFEHSDLRHEIKTDGWQILILKLREDMVNKVLNIQANKLTTGHHKALEASHVNRPLVLRTLQINFWKVLTNFDVKINKIPA